MSGTLSLAREPVQRKIRQDARVRIELPERLEGDDVVLRRLRPEDAPAYVAAFRADPELGRLLGMEKDPPEERIRERAAAPPGEGFAELAIGDSFAGSVILHSFDEHHRRCEVGFWLVPEARGRGLGSRAVAHAVTWAFEALDLLRVEMTTTPDNAAVFALAKRLGFTQEGVLRKRNLERGQRVDVVWFGVLREEWR
jgi:[ribosomal protein S5]-alanine N-acetyltransferase